MIVLSAGSQSTLFSCSLLSHFAASCSFYVKPPLSIWHQKQYFYLFHIASQRVYPRLFHFIWIIIEFHCSQSLIIIAESSILFKDAFNFLRNLLVFQFLILHLHFLWSIGTNLSKFNSMSHKLYYLYFAKIIHFSQNPNKKLVF